MVAVTLLTKDQAFAGRPPSKGKGKRRKTKTYHGRPAVAGTREARALLKTRPKGYAAAYSLHIEPWLRVKGHTSVASVVAELQEHYGKRIHIPETNTQGMAMAFYEGRWHRIMILEERVHIRKLRGAWGLAQPGYMPCDACFFRTDSRELQPIAVGRSNATMQVFHVCVPCISEGVLGRTSAKGFKAKRLE